MDMNKNRFNRMISSLLCLCAIFCMSACSLYEEEGDNIIAFEQPRNHRITVEQAKQNAINFVSQLITPTRGLTTPLTVSEVKSIGLREGITRSTNDSVNMDSLFYIVNFANKQGFVIASSDDRETPIFAFVEEGNYEEDDTLNNGYEAFIDALIDDELHKRIKKEYFQEDVSNNLVGEGGGGNTNYRSDKFEVMYPLLKTKWNQTTYAQYCPGDYTGCVVTAIAQICSFLKQPNHVAWGYNGVGNQCTMDWDRIIDECSVWYGNPYPSSLDLRDQIANLMRFWGLAFNADYGEGGTSVDSDDAISTMQEFGYNVTGLTDYNATDVINDLKQGNRIIYMRGNARYYHVGFVFRKYVDGHGWVVDGYIDTIKNNNETLYLHCNWGWGGYRNGYFLADVFNAEETPYYDDNANAITRSANFQYRLKTSTICK